MRLCLGGSYRKHRESDRRIGNLKFITLNNEGIKDQFEVGDYGQINDIRRIDGLDHGHNNPYKFPLSIN